VFPSDREGVPRSHEDDCSIERYDIGLSLFANAYKIDSSEKRNATHIHIADAGSDSDNDMQMMDQTPTPTGSSDTFSFSPNAPNAPLSQPLNFDSAADDFGFKDDAVMDNPDPFWTEDLFTNEAEVIAEEETDLGKMGEGGDVMPDIYQWREG
jgi:hypothetical protein